MGRLLMVVALAGLAMGTRLALDHARVKRARRAQGEALTTWETEGGAVPVATNRTAAQVEPGPQAAVG
jgi:hypothetical protein